MSAYTHDTYVGKDGFTRCRDCRAASYNPSILSGIPCTRKEPEPLKLKPFGHDLIVVGPEPILPQIGTIWMDANKNVWVWGEMTARDQGWIDVETGKEMESHELRLPVTSKHAAMHELGVGQAISDELLRLMNTYDLDRILNDLRLRAYAQARTHNEIIVTMPRLHSRKNPTYSETQFAITMGTRPLPPSLIGKVDPSKRPLPITTVEELKRLSI